MNDPRQNLRFKASTKRSVREAMEPHRPEATTVSPWWTPLAVVTAMASPWW